MVYNVRNDGNLTAHALPSGDGTRATMLRTPLQETAVVSCRCPSRSPREVLRLAQRTVQPIRPHSSSASSPTNTCSTSSTAAPPQLAAGSGGRPGRTGSPSANGVLAPDVLAAAQAGEALDYVATLALAGRALWVRPYLSGASLTRVLRAAGEHLRRCTRSSSTASDPVVGAPPSGCARAVVPVRRHRASAGFCPTSSAEAC